MSSWYFNRKIVFRNIICDNQTADSPEKTPVVRTGQNGQNAPPKDDPRQMVHAETNMGKTPSKVGQMGNHTWHPRHENTITRANTGLEWAQIQSVLTSQYYTKSGIEMYIKCLFYNNVYIYVEYSSLQCRLGERPGESTDIFSIPQTSDRGHCKQHTNKAKRLNTFPTCILLHNVPNME